MSGNESDSIDRQPTPSENTPQGAPCQASEVNLGENPVDPETFRFLRDRTTPAPDAPSDAEGKRYPFRGYINGDTLAKIAQQLGRQIKLSEAKSLVSEDGEVTECAAGDRCTGWRARQSLLFQPVRSVKIDSEAKDVETRANQFGDLVRFVEHCDWDDELIPLERGSFFVYPIFTGEQITCWKPKAFCGSIYFWSKAQNRVLMADPLKSCLQCQCEAFSQLPRLTDNLPEGLAYFVGKNLSKEWAERVAEAINIFLHEKRQEVIRTAKRERNELIGGAMEGLMPQRINDFRRSSRVPNGNNVGNEIKKASPKLSHLNGQEVVAKLPEA